MRRLGFVLAILLAFVFSGCGSSSDDANTVSSMSAVSTNTAKMGPLAKAGVSVYKLSDLKSAVETTVTDSKGAFGLTLSGLDDNEMVLVSVSGGSDIDINDDGVEDAVPTPNSGTIHAYAKVSDLKDGKVSVTFLSELVYLYTQSFISEIGKSITMDDFEVMVDKTTQEFIAANYKDKAYNTMISFDPTSKDRDEYLDFNYSMLLDGNNSLAYLYHTNGKDRNNTVSTLFAKLPITMGDDKIISAKETVKISLVPSHVKIHTDGISFPADTYEQYVPKDSNFSISIDEVDEGYRVLKWSGCDMVSSDLTTCEVANVQDNRLIVPVVVPEVKVKTGTVIRDISQAYVSIDSNESNATNTVMEVFADTKDTNTSELLSLVNIDDILVHKTVPVFFGKVIKKTKVNDFRYSIEIVKVALEDILTDGYITTDPSKSGTATTATSSVVLSKTIELPDGKVFYFDPNEKPTIKIKFNDDGEAVYSKDVEFESDGEGGYSVTTNLGDAKLSGSLTITPKVDFDVAWSFFGGLESISFVGGVQVDDDISITMDDKWSYSKDISLKTLTYTQVVAIGPIPIVITEPIEIYVGAEANVESSGKIGISASISPMLKFAWSKKGAEAGIDFNQKYSNYLEASASMDAFAYLGVYPSVQVYGIGIGIDNKFGPYLKLSGEGSAISTDGKDVNIAAGLYGEYGLKYVGTFKLNSSWKFVDSALAKINERLPGGGEYEKIWKRGGIEKSYSDAEDEKTAGYLTVSGDKYISVSDTVSNGINLLKDYVITNSGETPIYWKAKAFYPAGFNISLNTSGTRELTGELQPGESATVSENILSLSSVTIGEYTMGLEIYQSALPLALTSFAIPVYKATAQATILPEELDFKTTDFSADVVGTTIKKLEFSWSDNSYSKDLDGYFIYKSDYDEKSGTCADSPSRFMTIANSFSKSAVSDSLLNLMESSDNQVKIEEDKKYCFVLTGYKDFTSSLRREYVLSKNAAILTPLPSSSDVDEASGELDIVFVVDVSGSYGDDLSTFRAQSTEIVNALKDSLPSGMVLKIGLTSFSDYPEYGSSDDYAYKLEQPLSGDLDQFTTSIDNLELHYGGDYAESQLEALYQTATSSDIGWAKGSTKFVLLFTDASFHNSDTETTYPGHGFNATEAALDSYGISVVGMGSGYISDDLNRISDWTFLLGSDSSGVVEKLKEVILSVPGTEVSSSTAEKTVVAPIYPLYPSDYIGPAN